MQRELVINEETIKSFKSRGDIGCISFSICVTSVVQSASFPSVLVVIITTRIW